MRNNNYRVKFHSGCLRTFTESHLGWGTWDYDEDILPLFDLVKRGVSEIVDEDKENNGR